MAEPSRRRLPSATATTTAFIYFSALHGEEPGRDHVFLFKLFR